MAPAEPAFDYAANDLDSLATRYSDLLPELVIAFARPQGTDDKAARKALRELLGHHGFTYIEVEISDLISSVATQLSTVSGAPMIKTPTGYSRSLHLMQWGDDLRSTIDPGVGAMLAIQAIREMRPDAQDLARGEKRSGIAFVVRNLMHPQEVALLRSVYKQRFFLIGLHEAYEVRHANLADRFRRDGDESTDAEQNARHVLEIDAGLRPSAGNFTDGSLNIDNTFHQADVFIEAEENRCHDVLERWTNQVFGYPFGSPNTTELGMAFAYLAARASVALGRSVGAALVAPSGSLLAAGWNEVAQAHGGLYRQGSETDYRDHKLGHDPSDSRRIDAVRHFLQALLFAEWSEEDVRQLPEESQEWLKRLRIASEPLVEVPRSAVRALPGIRALATTRIFNLIEFGRAVHAEMAAITDAVRRGVPIAGAHMYVTTFPCHECARNIVASGITRVEFVEPYGKSLSKALYKDSIKFLTSPAHRDDERQVIFAPYVGISPKRFDELFSSVPRKYSLAQVARDSDLEEGGIVEWSENEPNLRPSVKGYSSEGTDTDPHFEVAQQMAENSVVRRLTELLGRQYQAQGVGQRG